MRGRGPVSALQRAAADRVESMRIEAGRDEHELRSEFERRGEDDPFEQREPQRAVWACGYRKIECVSLAGTRARIGDRPGAGIDLTLVDAREQDIWPAREYLSCSIAVMDIPVQDEHPFQLELCDRVCGGYRDVIEKTESRRGRSRRGDRQVEAH